jgi:hypothetical protein
MKKIHAIVLILLLFPAARLLGQDYSSEVKEYFMQYLNNNNLEDYFLQALPTREECRMVFQSEYIDTYYAFVEEMRPVLESETRGIGDRFVDIRVQVFSTQDIYLNKGNYAGGMRSIEDKLQPYVLFYQVKLLKEVGAEFGLSYNYIVRIGDRWVLFPKPWRAFD